MVITKSISSILSNLVYNLYMRYSTHKNFGQSKSKFEWFFFAIVFLFSLS
uniref:Uncharacterized protein n=1 Tax=Physcomitrium patens TaxID=3218 RepID=A0A2K1JQE2_PHYPA|nr:hypothetical protein PHYPA_016017 [Physcomitrium patens]